MRLMPTLLVLSLLPCVVTAQTSPAAQAGRKWRQAHEHAIIEEFVSLLSIPNIARDRENIQRNAEAIARMLEKRSIPAKLIAVPGSNPIVFGEIRTPGATRTIVFYAHYDGQRSIPRSGAARLSSRRYAMDRSKAGAGSFRWRLSDHFFSRSRACMPGRPRTTRRRLLPSLQPLTRCVQPV